MFAAHEKRPALAKFLHPSLPPPLKNNLHHIHGALRGASTSRAPRYRMPARARPARPLAATSPTCRVTHSSRSTVHADLPPSDPQRSLPETEPWASRWPYADALPGSLPHWRAVGRPRPRTPPTVATVALVTGGYWEHGRPLIGESLFKPRSTRDVSGHAATSRSFFRPARGCTRSFAPLVAARARAARRTAAPGAPSPGRRSPACTPTHAYSHRNMHSPTVRLVGGYT